jgi:NhaA family Na+:H+ antiporter
MTTHALPLHAPHTPHRAPPYASRGRPHGRIASIVRFATEHYLLLPAGAVIALVWANTWPESYFTMAAALAFPVNEIAMVLFFGLVAQEMFEEMMPGGALHPWRRWIVPIVAAAGGVAGAALLYAAYVGWMLEPMLQAGWPVVAGVDIAFAYFIVKSIFRRHPAVSFLLLLAVASNAIGVLALAPQYLVADTRAGGAAVLMAAAMGLAALLRRLRVRIFWPYLVGAGGLSWLALYVEGFHPGLALVPIVPFLPHARRTLDNLFADADDAAVESPRHFEHVWSYPVQVSLLLFGLVNAGVMLSGYGNGTWATVTASLAGRTLGILSATGAAVALGLHLPAHLRWRELTVVALAASCGFTFSLFFATAAFPAGPLLAELKLGALLSGAGVLLALAAARLLHVGRFTRRAHDRPHAAHHGA